MEVVWVLSDDELETIKVSSVGPEGEEANDDVHDNDLLGTVGTSAPGPEFVSAAHVQGDPIAPAGVTRSGLVRGNPSSATASSKVPRPPKSISSKRKKFTARDFAETDMSTSEFAGSLPREDYKLKDEVEGDYWSDDLQLDDLPSSKKMRTLDADTLGDGLNADQPVGSPAAHSPVRSIALEYPPVGQNVHGSGPKPSETGPEMSPEGLESFLNNLLPGKVTEEVRQLSDSEFLERSDRVLHDHLSWALGQRSRFKTLFHECAILRSQLEVQSIDVQQLRVEVTNLRKERKAWVDSSEKINELEATKLSLEDALLKANSVAQERASVIAAKEDLIDSLNSQLNAKDGQILTQGDQIAARDACLAKLKGQLQAETDAKDLAISELKKLHSGLDVVGSKLLRDPSVTKPFTAYAEGLKEYGGHRAASLAQKLFAEDPSKMPPELSQMIKPECRDKVKELFEGIRHVKSAYIARVVAAEGLSVDEILAIEP